MKRVLTFPLPALVVLLAAYIGSTAEAQESPDLPHGIFFNGGLGWGSASWTCDNCKDSGRENALAYHLAFGWAVGRRFVPGIEGTFWKANDVFGGVNKVKLESGYVTTTWYPLKSGHLALKVGVGEATWKFKDPQFKKDDSGWGFLVSTGYDFGFGYGWHISPTVRYEHGLMGDKAGFEGVSQGVLTLGVDLTAY